MAIHPAAEGFRAAAELYDRARPDYPDEAGRWLAEKLDLRPGRRVVDIAAGTGKLTRVLVDTGASVVAIEPVAEMRSRLTSAPAQVRALDGTAEKMPLSDASVDAATVGQAFHWFAGEPALVEIHRVVAGAGRLAVVYNRRPLDDPLHGAIEAIIAPVRGDAPAHRSGRWRDAFVGTPLWAPVEEAELAHAQQLDREGVIARVASISFIAKLASDRRAEVLGQVRSLVEGAPEPIELPYICELFVWQRLP